MKKVLAAMLMMCAIGPVYAMEDCLKLLPREMSEHIATFLMRGEDVVPWIISKLGSSAEFLEHKLALSSATFNADEDRVFTTSYDCTAKIWCTKTGKSLGTFNGHSAAVLCGDLSPNGNLAITGSSDETAKIWETKTCTCLHTLEGHGGNVKAVAFNSVGDRVATGLGNGTVKIWNVEDGSLLVTLDGHNDAILAVVFSSDGNTLLTGSKDTHAKLWNIADGMCIRTFNCYNWVNLGKFSDDGKKVILGSIKKMYIFDLDVDDSEPIIHSFDSYFGDLNEDETTVSTHSYNEINFKKLQADEPFAKMEHKGQISTTKFSRSGDRVVTASDSAKIWDLAKILKKRKYLSERLSVSQAVLVRYIFDKVIMGNRDLFNFDTCPHLQPAYDALDPKAKQILAEYVSETDIVPDQGHFKYVLPASLFCLSGALFLNWYF